MNVSVAGYLQLANALLGVAMGIAFLVLGSNAEGYRVDLGIFAFAIFTGVVGIGLLGRRAWARWLMLGPGLLAVTGNRDMLIKESGRGKPDRFWLAQLDLPPEHTQFELQELRPASGETLFETLFETLSPDGRYALFATPEGKLEIVDLRSQRHGGFDSRTLDFRAGTQLESTQTVSGTERRTHTWWLPGTGDKQGSGANPYF